MHFNSVKTAVRRHDIQRSVFNRSFILIQMQTEKFFFGKLCVALIQKPGRFFRSSESCPSVTGEVLDTRNSSAVVQTAHGHDSECGRFLRIFGKTFVSPPPANIARNS